MERAPKGHFQQIWSWEASEATSRPIQRLRENRRSEIHQPQAVLATADTATGDVVVFVVVLLLSSDTVDSLRCLFFGVLRLFGDVGPVIRSLDHHYKGDLEVSHLTAIDPSPSGPPPHLQSSMVIY